MKKTVLIIANNKYQVLEIVPLIRFLLNDGVGVSVICERVYQNELAKICDNLISIDTFETVPSSRIIGVVNAYKYRKQVFAVLQRRCYEAILCVGLVGRGAKSVALQYSVANKIPFYVVHTTRFHVSDQVASLRSCKGIYRDYSLFNRVISLFLRKYLILVDDSFVFVERPITIVLSILFGYASADKYWTGELSRYPIRLVTNLDQKEHVARFLPETIKNRILVTGIPREDDAFSDDSSEVSVPFVLFLFPPFEQLGIVEKAEILAIVHEIERIVNNSGLRLMISPHPRLREGFHAEFGRLIKSEVTYVDTPRLFISAIALISVASSLQDMALKIGLPVIDLTWLHNYVYPKTERCFQLGDIIELGDALDVIQKMRFVRIKTNSCETIANVISGTISDNGKLAYK